MAFKHAQIGGPGGLLLFPMLLLFIALMAAIPYRAQNGKVKDQLGHTVDEARSELGGFAQEWKPGEFACAADEPCERKGHPGAAALHRWGGMAWYLYFDAAGKVEAVE